MARATIALAAATLLGFLVTAAAADNGEILETECHKRLKLSDSGCACIRERAAEQLNEQQQALVVAMVLRDYAKINALQGQMSEADVTGATDFMSQAPQQCAGQ